MTALCHVCRYVRPIRLMRVDESTRKLLHPGEGCELIGGMMVCDEERVRCGSPDHATGRMTQGLREDGSAPA